jgi:hypothetical protein
VQWAERTPDAFTFHIKAFRLLTGHWAELKVLPPDLREAPSTYTDKRGRLYPKDLPGQTKDALWSAMEQSLAPPHKSGKLGTVLFQFAPWVPPGKGIYEHIEECKARLPDYQLAIEFRNKAWFDRGLEETLLRQAADREPERLSVPLAVTKAGELPDAGLDPETPVFTHFYLPRDRDSVSAVFGVDLGTPVGQTQGRFVSHPRGDLGVSETDDLHEVVFVAVPPWEDDSVAAFDRRGRRREFSVLDVEPPAESAGHSR